MENLTDEELIQIYDLQEKCAEEIINFVRRGDENEVMKFLQAIPELNHYESKEKKIFRKSEFSAKHAGEKIPQGRFIYKESSEWKGADTLREIFDDMYMWEFTAAQPETLALLAGKIEIALENYSIEEYEKLREEIPQKLLDKIKNLTLNYPEEISGKAFEKAVYGYSSDFRNRALSEYIEENRTEFEKIQEVTQWQKNDTIVKAYDLQANLKNLHPELKEKNLLKAIENFCNNETVFKIIYGEKMTEILKQADKKVLDLARKYNFVDTEEKLQVLENHKICLFGTLEQKIKIPYKENNFDLSEKDFAKILEVAAEKYESEGFSKKYYPSGKNNQEYAHQSYKVVGRYKAGADDAELQPQWNIIFDDGKIITAKADEIISSEINNRFYGEQAENFGKRPLEKILAVNEEKLNLYEGREKISAIIRQLQKNGESVKEIKNFLEMEQENLSKTSVR